MLRLDLKHFSKYIILLILNSLIASFLLIIVSIYSHNFSFSYFIWNLFLSWVPLLVSVILIYILKNKLWSSWPALIISFIWLIFLPNSFYMITDFIHLMEVPNNYLLYFVVAFTAIICSASINGYISLYLIHRELKKRLSSKSAWVLVALISLISSYAIYIGRVLRWNSWDILTNPGGVIFDVSDNFINLNSLKNSIFTTFLFFVLIFSIYILIDRGLKFLIKPKIIS